jgi:hypothetical protein
MMMDTTDGGREEEATTPPARQGSSWPLVNTMLEANDRSFETG